MDDIIMIGPMRFNARQLQVECNGKTVRLTPNEARTLYFLATHANTVCTSSQLSSAVYGDDNSDTMIKLSIRHLRQKVEPDPNSPTYILTVPGVGYQLIIPGR